MEKTIVAHNPEVKGMYNSGRSFFLKSRVPDDKLQAAEGVEGG